MNTVDSSVSVSSLSDCARSKDYMEDVEKWRDHSHIWENNSFLFYDFVCKKIRYDLTKQHCEAIEAGWVLGLGVCGFMGALLSLFTFCRRPFVASDVYLYRTVGVLECVHMAIMTFMHVSSYFDCYLSYFCVFFSAHIYMTGSNLCAEAVEFIVVFLSIERTVACLTPQYFYRFHRIGAYRTVAVLALITSSPLNLIHSFDMTIESDQVGYRRHYREVPSSFASTSFYDGMIDAQMIKFILVAPLLILSTIGSIIGLLKAVKRKRRLRGPDFPKISTSQSPSSVGQVVELSHNGESGLQQTITRLRSMSSSTRKSSTSEERNRKEIKQMVELCCLQLCLAIPIVINYLLCLAERAAKWRIVIAERHKIYEEAFGNMTYNEASIMIDRATALEYLRFAISLTHMMAHGLHFYLYLSFSAKFRHALCVWLRLESIMISITKRVGTDTHASSNIGEARGNGHDYLPIPSSSTATRPGSRRYGSTSSSNHLNSSSGQRRSWCDY